MYLNIDGVMFDFAGNDSDCTEVFNILADAKCIRSNYDAETRETTPVKQHDAKLTLTNFLPNFF